MTMIRGLFNLADVAFNSNGRRVVAAAENVVRIFDATILSEDERVARFHVDRLFEKMCNRDEVMSAIERATMWSETLRNAALQYARLRARKMKQTRVCQQPANGLPANGEFGR